MNNCSLGDVPIVKLTSFLNPNALKTELLERGNDQIFSMHLQSEG